MTRPIAASINNYSGAGGGNLHRLEFNLIKIDWIRLTSLTRSRNIFRVVPIAGGIPHARDTSMVMSETRNMK